MKKSLQLIPSILLLYSCDYTGVYFYEVKNETTESALEVKFQKHNDTILRSVIVYPSTTERIMKDGSGLIGMHDDPRDMFKDSINDFKFIDLYIDGNKIEENFKARSFWSFTQNGDQSSTYTLKITDSLIHSE